jgi:hypothetical protein
MGEEKRAPRGALVSGVTRTFCISPQPQASFSWPHSEFTGCLILLGAQGATIFAHACKLGMEGIVSKRRDFAYSSGRSKGWLKVKNPKAPAALRIEEGTF